MTTKTMPDGRVFHDELKSFIERVENDFPDAHLPALPAECIAPR